MFRFLKVVLYVMCILSFVGEVFSIKCWICSSDQDRDCADPFDNRTIPLTDCNEEHDGVLQTLCLKMTQRSGNSKVIYRGCAPPTHSFREDCVTYKEGNKLIENCTCNSKRGCNSSGIISSTPWIIIVSVVCGLCKFLKEIF